MSLARSWSVTLSGVSGAMVEIEADLSAGLPGVAFTGLADTTVVEARDRIRAAIVNSGLEWPNRKITVALLPADIRKIGSRFDLALALAVLGCADQVPHAALADAVWLAELGLDGRLRPIRGMLPSIRAAHQAGMRHAVVAPGNAAEAALVPDVDVRAAVDLRNLVLWLRGEAPAPERAEPGPPDPDQRAVPDLADVAGQATARRALEVAAAGGHHACFIGSPGAGKTMLAERLPGILPQLDDDAALEVTTVYSVAGLLGPDAHLVRRPPLQAPHHTASVASLVGGGSQLARPGAISLAHHGVLFLDEAAEFSPRALDALRQPLENGVMTLHRSGGAVSYPARFQLVLAANPCPCGSRGAECACAPALRRRYQQRLSGPLLDRVDLRIQVDPVPQADLFATADRESSAAVAVRVLGARNSTLQRWGESGWRINRAVPGRDLRCGRWRLSRAALRPAERYLERGQLSARGFDRVLRLAWSIADLAGHTVPDAGDVAEALYFRTGDAGQWAA
ncbi:MAG TPA: YifB family Mg chelatase-like AAA ATPase [Jatrophihabitantaceae bacterium]|jgi:magnesium chelatase family protein|nr:YifB family Mg chelatase-like AAA ATPase [Jatrophihabitantaceae bacterium]